MRTKSQKNRGQSKFVTLTPGILLLLCAASFTLQAAESMAPDEIRVTAEMMPGELWPGAMGQMVLKLHMAPGSHANANFVMDRKLIPTTFFPAKQEGIDWGKIRYPKPTQVIEWYSIDPLSVFEDGTEIHVPVTLGEDITADMMTLEGKLRVQICDDEKCYPPERVEISTELPVVE